MGKHKKNTKSCGKMIKKRGMPEARPCLLKKGPHGGRHSPDLTRLKNVFGYAEILKRAPDYRYLNHRAVCWQVLDKFGEKRVVHANSLFRGSSFGKIVAKNSALSSRNCNRKIKPEYRAIESHYRHIFNPRGHAYKNYKGMPFFDGWNPNRGGSFTAGMVWLKENLPKRKKKDHLHIIDRRVGFVPGNLMWIPNEKHNREELLNKTLTENRRLKKELEKLKNARGKARL